MKPEIDKLTGLKSRKQFFKDFETLVKEGQSGGVPIASLALLDIDFFGRLNDKHGEAIGDEIIIFLGKHLTQSLGGAGQVYRYGGEEFVLLFPGTEKEDAFLLMERVRSDYNQSRNYKAKGQEVTEVIGFSTGVSTYGEDGNLIEDVLRKADDALYRAKETGRNKVCISREEKMVPKTVHYTQGQLKRLSKLKEASGLADSVLLREALDDLLRKYKAS